MATSHKAAIETLPVTRVANIDATTATTQQQHGARRHYLVSPNDYPGPSQTSWAMLDPSVYRRGDAL